MTSRRGKFTLVLLMVVLCGVVFHAPFTVWFGTVWPELQIEVKAWKEILLLVTTLLLTVEVTRRKLWGELWNDRLIRLSAAYAGLHVVMLLWMWQGTLPAVAALMINLRFVLFFVVLYSALRIYPEWRKPLLIGSVVVAGVSMLFALLQVTVLPHDFLSHIGYSIETISPYLTVDRNYDYIRINSTLRGPNPLGAYAAIIFTVSTALLLRVKGRIYKVHTALPWLVVLLAGASLVALWFSYSRSAALAAGVGFGIVAIVKYGQKVSPAIWGAGVAVLLLMVGGVYMARDTHFISHVILHEDPNEGNDINSNDGHWHSLVDGATRMSEQPLGAGIGSTGSPSLMTESPLILENQFFYIAHEVGWLGLMLFIALQGLVLYRLWRARDDWLALGLFASGIGLVVANMLLPVWADDTVAMVWWGLSGVALGAVAARYKKGEEDD